MSAYDVTGRIFDIQRFSVHDGPGIRTIVFFKGCYLRCRWCCNPESQSYEFEEMTLGGKTKTVGRDVTVGEVLETVREDRAYYEMSGGGLTLSGGEATAQPDFAEALLSAARAEGIHTAIETTAFAPKSVLARLLPHLDLVMMDVKHMDSKKHEEYTGRPNEEILENARFVAERARELIVRVPVIPTFNDTEEEIRAIARFANSLPGVRRLHLLPYHRLGQDKYKGLGREYLMEGEELIPPEKMNRLLRVAEEASGLLCQIGG
jgi:pyruvate formate lyase activating enzyme